VGTVLPLSFLPAFYMTWFRVKAPDLSSVLTHKVLAISERHTRLILSTYGRLIGW
jgi:hypothetical protein